MKGDTTLLASFFVENLDGKIIPGQYAVKGTQEAGTMEFGSYSFFSAMFGLDPTGTFVKISSEGSDPIYGLGSGGFINITETGEGSYSFEINLELEGAYRFTGSYSGFLEIAPAE